MKRLAVLCAVATMVGCAASSGTALSPRLYSRIPARIEGFELTERTVVRDVPSDSVFRFSDGSQTTLTVIVYDVADDVTTDGDPQLMAALEGAKFEQLQDLRVSRGQIEAYTEAVSDTVRFSAGRLRLLEHSTAIPVRFRNGAVAVDMQFLYLIDGKFVKVRATIPAEGWEQSRVPSFARELARRMAGAG